jgi:ferric-dicitrate binding protein FerR (iron transport regulator)
MSNDRFEEIISSYADGKATPEELAELENRMKLDESLRREFVERIRLEVSLGALYESAAATAPSSRRAPRPVRSAAPRNRMAVALVAAILLGFTIYLATRTRPEPVSGNESIERQEARVEPARNPEEERIQAELDRKGKEARLAELQVQEVEAARLERRKDEEARRQDEVSRLRLQAEREAAEAALRAAETRERRAIENVTPPPPVSPPPAPATTQVIVARIDRVDGKVSVLAPTGRAPATAGQELPAGVGIECGDRSFAVLGYPDRTRVEVASNTVVRDLFDTKGKQFYVEKGTVKADVAKQPKDRPMIAGMPHGETKVLGTIFRLTVDPKSAILEVEEGKVELRNLAGRTLDVPAGRMAVTSAGATLSTKALPAEEGVVALDFEDGKAPALVMTGTVERGPDRAGNRFCLAGAADPSGVSRLFIGDGVRGLFTYQGDEVLSFDYWVDPQAVGVNFNFFDRTRGRGFEAQLPKIVLGKWTHVSIRLADLGDAANRIREDDWIIQLYVQAVGGATPVKRFYVDNVQVTRSRSLKPRK